jgi:hypothetical protein
VSVCDCCVCVPDIRTCIQHTLCSDLGYKSLVLGVPMHALYGMIYIFQHP